MISGDRSVSQGEKGAFWYTLEEFRKHWQRVDVIVPKTKCIETQNLHPFENVWFHPSPRGLWYQPLWILQKGKESYRQRTYNVMTVHEYPPFYNGLGAWLLHRATSIPYVSEIHHVVGYPTAASIQEWIGRKLYPLYIRTIGRAASAFRVVNSGTRELLAQWGVEQERMYLVPSFYLNHELLTPDPSIEKTYDIVFCGRLVPNKGVEELFSAVAEVPEPTLRVLIIGDGLLCPKLKAQSSKLKAHVTFAGWLPSPHDVYRAMQSAKIFVMCSKSEGGPRVLLEAMALGLPVIATNVGVVPDVIRDGENGLITTGTSEDLAEKIQHLLSNDELCARLGQRAREVLQMFERKKLIQEYARFLQSFGSSL